MKQKANLYSIPKKHKGKYLIHIICFLWFSLVFPFHDTIKASIYLAKQRVSQFIVINIDKYIKLTNHYEIISIVNKLL